MDETATNAPGRPQRLRFGDFVLDTRRAELRRAAVVVPLRPKPFALLETLVRNAGTVQSKEALLAAVWPGVVVTDDSLAQAVHDLRARLGDAGAALITTVARRGYRFDGQVVAEPDGASVAVEAGPAAALPSPGRQRALSAFGALVTLALIVALAVYGWLRPASTPAPPARSIVVLPLTLAVDSGEPWFADALWSDLTTQLGQCDDALVISRDTAHTYRGRAVDARQVARELGVRHVVQGSVRRDAERVQLSLQMVDGATGMQQWAHRFAFDRARLRPALDEVVTQLAYVLSVQMYRSDGVRSTVLDSVQVQAEDLAMQAWALWYRGMTRDNVREAARLHRAAVALDPQLMRAWGGIAAAESTLLGSDWADDRPAALARLEQAAERLQALDANHGYTFIAKAGLARVRDDWRSLLGLADDAAARFPNQPLPHFNRGFAALMLGRFDDCVEPTKRAIRIGPRDPLLGLWHWQIAACHLLRGEPAEAAERARLAQQANPTLALPPLVLAAALARLGRAEEAQAVIDDFRARRPQYGVANVERILRSDAPRWREANGRFVETLRSLGLP